MKLGLISVTMRSELSYIEMTPLPILLVAVFLGRPGTLFPKSLTGAFSSNSRLDVHEVQARSIRAFTNRFEMKIFRLEVR